MNAEKQFCPICKTEVDVSSRYPNYICQSCVSKTTDQDGKTVSFHNESILGHGCVGVYQSGMKYNSNECYIDGVKCYAEEAYFGGIVLRPMQSKKGN